MKFQLVHFTAIHGKPFKLYSDIANSKKDFLNVDLGKKNNLKTTTTTTTLWPLFMDGVQLSQG